MFFQSGKSSEKQAAPVKSEDTLALETQQGAAVEAIGIKLQEAGFSQEEVAHVTTDLLAIDVSAFEAELRLLNSQSKFSRLLEKLTSQAFVSLGKLPSVQNDESKRKAAILSVTDGLFGYLGQESSSSEEMAQISQAMASAVAGGLKDMHVSGEEVAGIMNEVSQVAVSSVSKSASAKGIDALEVVAGSAATGLSQGMMKTDYDEEQISQSMESIVVGTMNSVIKYAGSDEAISKIASQVTTKVVESAKNSGASTTFVQQVANKSLEGLQKAAVDNNLSPTLTNQIVTSANSSIASAAQVVATAPNVIVDGKAPVTTYTPPIDGGIETNRNALLLQISRSSSTSGASTNTTAQDEPGMSFGFSQVYFDSTQPIVALTTSSDVTDYAVQTVTSAQTCPTAPTGAWQPLAPGNPLTSTPINQLQEGGYKLCYWSKNSKGSIQSLPTTVPFIRDLTPPGQTALNGVPTNTSGDSFAITVSGQGAYAYKHWIIKYPTQQQTCQGVNYRDYSVLLNQAIDKTDPPPVITLDGASGDQAVSNDWFGLPTSPSYLLCVKVRDKAGNYADPPLHHTWEQSLIINYSPTNPVTQHILKSGDDFSSFTFGSSSEVASLVSPNGDTWVAKFDPDPTNGLRLHTYSSSTWQLDDSTPIIASDADVPGPPIQLDIYKSNTTIAVLAVYEVNTETKIYLYHKDGVDPFSTHVVSSDCNCQQDAGLVRIVHATPDSVKISYVRTINSTPETKELSFLTNTTFDDFDAWNNPSAVASGDYVSYVMASNSVGEVALLVQTDSSNGNQIHVMRSTDNGITFDQPFLFAVAQVQQNNQGDNYPQEDFELPNLYQNETHLLKTATEIALFSNGNLYRLPDTAAVDPKWIHARVEIPAPGGDYYLSSPNRGKILTVDTGIIRLLAFDHHRAGPEVLSIWHSINDGASWQKEVLINDLHDQEILFAQADGMARIQYRAYNDPYGISQKELVTLDGGVTWITPPTQQPLPIVGATAANAIGEQALDMVVFGGKIYLLSRDGLMARKPTGGGTWEWGHFRPDAFDQFEPNQSMRLLAAGANLVVIAPGWFAKSADGQTWSAGYVNSSPVELAGQDLSAGIEVVSARAFGSAVHVVYLQSDENLNKEIKYFKLEGGQIPTVQTEGILGDQQNMSIQLLVDSINANMYLAYSYTNSQAERELVIKAYNNSASTPSFNSLTSILASDNPELNDFEQGFDLVADPDRIALLAGRGFNSFDLGTSIWSAPAMDFDAGAGVRSSRLALNSDGKAMIVFVSDIRELWSVTEALASGEWDSPLDLDSNDAGNCRPAVLYEAGNSIHYASCSYFGYGMKYHFTTP
jgi:hypothetical protein